MWAKQSTAATLIVGPILDSAGAEYTGAVIGDLSLSKNGGTLTAMAAAATLTHIANGQYTLVTTTGNLDTLGRAQITCNKSTYQMPEVRLMVVPAMVFDSLILGTDDLDTNTKKWNDLTTVALPLVPTTAGRTLDVSAGGEAGIDWANVGSPTAALALTGTTIAVTQKVDVETIKTQALTAGAGITFGVYVGGTAAAAIASTALSTAQWTNTLATNLGTTNTTVATNLNETVASRLASASYTAPPSAATISTQVASDLATAHGAGSWATATGFSTHSAADVWAVGTRTITGGSLTTSPPTAAVIADAVWDEARAGHVTAGTFGEKVNAELDSATQTQVTNIENASGYLLALQAGAISNPQTATETYAITTFGSTFTVALAGLTSTGTRTAPTLTKT